MVFSLSNRAVNRLLLVERERERGSDVIILGGVGGATSFGHRGRRVPLEIGGLDPCGKIRLVFASKCTSLYVPGYRVVPFARVNYISNGRRGSHVKQ